jgi:alpha-tubulin suppressor-like RCC1 family protein
LTLAPGASGTVAIGVARAGGFASPVDINVTNGPSTITAGQVTILSTENSGSFVVTVAANAQPGSYPLIVAGTSAMLFASAMLTVDVAAADASADGAAGDATTDAGAADGADAAASDAAPDAPFAGATPALSGGLQHVCSLRTNGTIACWGANDQGQLGDTTTMPNYKNGVAVSGLPGPATSIAAANQSTCARIADGTVVCWGANSNGMLGKGVNDTLTHASASLVPGLPGPARAIWSGTYAVFAELESGDVAVWGVNFFDEFGDGQSMHSYSPITEPALMRFTRMSGDDITCGLKDGVAYCWGVVNTHGELGNGTTTNPNFGPTKVMGITDTVTDVSAGFGAFGHACAVLSTQGIVCWGTNASGELGDGTNMDRSVATPVKNLPPAKRVTCGQGFTCALLVDGRLACWGDNTGGMLGLGVRGNTYSTPQIVPGLANVEAVAAGSLQACARTKDGKVSCWGLNEPSFAAPVFIPALGDQ